MKRLLSWSVLVIGVAINISLMIAVFYLFDILFSLLNKVPFLSDILDFAGELLDFSLSSLTLILLSYGGFKLIRSISQKICASKNNTRYKTVTAFCVIGFIAALIVFIYFFAHNIGPIYAEYTAGTSGLAYILTLFYSITGAYKLTILSNLFIYHLGYSFLIYSIIVALADQIKI